MSLLKYCSWRRLVGTRPLVLICLLISSPIGAVPERAGSDAAYVKVERGPDGSFRISGRTDREMVLEVSNDLRHWTGLEVKLPVRGPFETLDVPPPDVTTRYYRLKGVEPSGPPLADLSQLVNGVFIPGEGFNTIQFAPNGVLGFLVWRNEELVYRERGSDGSWTEAIICRDGLRFEPKPYDEHRFEPAAVLLFDPQSRPHILCVHPDGQTVGHYEQGAGGQWAETATLSPPDSVPGFALFAADIGPDGSLHLATVNASSSPVVTYGSNRSGAWVWDRVTAIQGHPRGFLRQSYSPRFFSMDVDSSNAAHLTFSPGFSLASGPEGYPRPNSELAYASNRSGRWEVERIAGPADGSGDAGLGACVAVGPDGRPAVAAWYDERAGTGSAQWSHLVFYEKNHGGGWSSTVVAKTPDNYAAGDGPKGTGFAPDLKFDASGRPHILFSDHAAEHFGQSGQNEYAGQVRHAVLNGSEWSIRTLFTQSGPLEAQMIYPSMALSREKIVLIGLQRATQWGPDTWPRQPPASQYRFLFLEAGMP